MRLNFKPLSNCSALFWRDAMQAIDFVGGRTRTRTWDPLIKSHLGIQHFQLYSDKSPDRAGIASEGEFGFAGMTDPRLMARRILFSGSARPPYSVFDLATSRLRAPSRRCFIV